ncbi:MAG: GTPase-associated system all-helical protein GASH [Elusimicrobiota bacterium]|nr:GTPase-associated system all-helical protein GASH [Elusimicrobiota bacterium]
MAMHKHFADWYRIAVPDPRQETLQLRWSSIEKIAASLDKAKGLEVVRIFLGLPTKDAAFADSFADFFKKDDAAFPLKNNKAELQVLAGSVIWECFDGPKPPQSIAICMALAVDAATFTSRKIKIPVPDIVTLAKEHLSAQSVAAHETDPVDISEIGTTRTALGPACKTNSAIQLEKPLDAYSKAVSDTLTTLIERNRALQEETNILWWLFGGHSNSLGRAFKEMDIAVAAIIAPVELTSLVNILPGPLSSRAIFSNLLRNVNKSRPAISIAEAIEAVAKDWKEKLFEGTHIEGALDLCPVMHAMKKSLDTSKKQWRAAAEKASQTPVAGKIAPLELSKQLFSEHLLLKSLAQ